MSTCLSSSGNTWEFAARYPRTLNALARDIRKRSFSSLSLEKDPSYSGPVIVKTDLNNGGRPELIHWRNLSLHAKLPGRLSALARFRFHRVMRRAAKKSRRRLSLALGGAPACAQMPLLAGRKPCRNATTAILQSAPIISRQARIVFSPLPPSRGRKRIRHANDPPGTRQPLAGHPQPARLRIHGKVDYVEIGGSPVLLDINKTVGLSSKYRNDPAVAASRRECAPPASTTISTDRHRHSRIFPASPTPPCSTRSKTAPLPRNTKGSLGGLGRPSGRFLTDSIPLKERQARSAFFIRCQLRWMRSAGIPHCQGHARPGQQGDSAEDRLSASSGQTSGTGWHP